VERKIKTTVKQRRRETLWKKGVNGTGEKGNRKVRKIMKRKGIKIDIKKEMQRELLNKKKIDSKSVGRRSIKEYFSSPFFIPKRTILIIE
jgi:hypothetical protein